MPASSKSLEFLALTGGIATGKSTCSSIIQQLLPETVVFDADVCVARLYLSQEIHRALLDYFGERVMLSTGQVNKSFLRQRVFNDLDDKTFVEQVFHQRVVKECLALFAKTATKGLSRLFVADIPLLFEGGFDLGQSANLLVATSRQTQVTRLKNRNAWDNQTVDAVLQSQMPIMSKFHLADVVFWNEGPVELLRSQCKRYLRSLQIPIA